MIASAFLCNSLNSTNIIPSIDDEMRNPDLPKYDWLVEKDTLIPNEEKRGKKILSLGGQNLQASIDDELRFRGCSIKMELAMILVVTWVIMILSKWKMIMIMQVIILLT